MKPVLFATLFLLACTGGARAQEIGAQTIHAPFIDFRLRVLPNGLKVYSVVDRTTTNVAVQVWYGVGARDDPPGGSGFAHLLEHLMFKGTRHVPPEFMDRLTDDVGGENNASTEEDYTEYEEVVPAAHLERLLWAEADRMKDIRVDQANFSLERGVVQQELREDETDDPYGRLFEFDIPQASFVQLPNRRSILGSMAELESAKLDDIQAFRSLYYRPDNAILIVVGDFDPDQLDAWVDRYFGPVARPAAPFQHAALQEPPRAGHRLTDVYAPRVPHPAVVLTYAGPDAKSADATALTVLDAVLTMGRTSRLNASLVTHRRVADEVVSHVELRQHAGLIEVVLVLADGATMAAAETALRSELDHLRQRPVTAPELRAAKNQLLLELLHRRETIDGIANALGEAAIVKGDAARVNFDVAELQAVTAADVQRVARGYLLDEQRVTIRYHPATRSGSAMHGVAVQGARPSPPAPGATAPAQTPAEVETSNSSALPPLSAGPVVAAVQPQVLEHTLANGLRVIAARTGAQPLVTASLILRGGSRLDPVGKAGLANLTDALARDSAGGRSTDAIADLTASLGVSVWRTTKYDSTSFTLSGLAPSLSGGLAILADIVRSPDLREARLRSVRRRISDRLSTSTADEESICDAAITPLVYGTDVQGQDVEGDPRSLARIALSDVRDEYDRLYRPENAILVVAGDVNPSTAFDLAERRFSDWRRPTALPPAIPKVRASPSGIVLAVDLPGAQQAMVVLAAGSVGRPDPSYDAAALANTILGGTVSSRLSTEIRIRRGLAYGVSSELESFNGGGLFRAIVQTSSTDAAAVAGLMLDQLDALRRQPPTSAELAAGKAHLIRDFDGAMETGDDLTELLTVEALYGADVIDLKRYPAELAALTAEQVRSGVSQLADPSRTSVLVVGDASRFLPALRARFGQVAVLPARTLDPDSLGRLRGAPHQLQRR